MKKLIRLTEGDLHHIVNESVKKVLTELDWKTYMNAARGRYQQGNYGAADELEGNAYEQLQKKYFGAPYRDYREVLHHKPYNIVNSLRSSAGMHGGQVDDAHLTAYEPERREVYRFGRGVPNGYSKEIDNGDNPDLEKASKTYNQTKQDMIDDMNDYYNDRSRYIKGKGWTR